VTVEEAVAMKMPDIKKVLDVGENWKTYGEYPGGQILAIVFVVIYIAAAMLFGKESFEVLLIGGLVLSVVVAVLYNVGSGLDPIFDVAFEPKTDKIPIIKWLSPEMREARRRAASHLKTGRSDPSVGPDAIKGVYRRAMVLYGDTKEWKQDGEVKLHISKAARNLIFPVILILLYHLWKCQLLQPMSPAEWMSKLDLFSVCIVLVLIGLFSLYVCLRVLHMKALYKLVPSAKFRQFACSLPDSDWGNKDRNVEELSSKGFLVFIRRFVWEENPRNAGIEVTRVWRDDCVLKPLFESLIATQVPDKRVFEKLISD
jgi:hypothetical protein